MSTSFPNRAAAAAALALGSAAIIRRVLLHRRAASSSASLRELITSGKKAVCVGKNYRAHINEMVNLGPEWKLEENPEPVLFIKPTSSYAWPGEPLVLPRARPDRGLISPVKYGVHHELELGVIIGKRAKDVASVEEAMECVAGYVLALDITERDEQTAAKVAGMPWSVSKGHDSFLPLSAPFTLRGGDDWRTLRLWLDVNGTRRQACEAGAMIHSVPALIMYASQVMTLEPGDLLVTGTPEGVAQLVAGDVVTAGVEGHVEMRVSVHAPTPPPLDLRASAHKTPLADPLITHCSPLGIQDATAGGPLARICIAIKDNIDMAGFVTGNGSPSWKEGRDPAPAHAPPVGALLAAGARLVGRAHMDELAFSIGGENSHYGTLDNPIAPGRTVGGSSSGSAVAVAMGLCDTALGTDTTGSIRVPSAHCGLYGMRPSHGALSGDGVCALAPTYDTVGWLARSADVLVAVGDILLPPTPTHSSRTNPNPQACILVADDLIDLYEADNPAVTSAARRAVDAAAAAAAEAMSTPPRARKHIRLGEVLLAQAPKLRCFVTDPADPSAGLHALLQLMREEQAIEIWGALSPFLEPPGASPPLLGGDVSPRVQWARGVASSDAATPEARSIRRQAREEVQGALNTLLADGSLLCFIPVAAPPPPPAGAANPEYRQRTFTLQGPSGVGCLPQVVLPVGRCAATRLPLSATLVAARGEDRRLLALAPEVGGGLATQSW